ncbi:MAG: DUF1579 family protein [Phycisphaeraceae bacterium]|nr:DUF1579 family protein [Phycisphaeraceae bacterium]
MVKVNSGVIRASVGIAAIVSLFAQWGCQAGSCCATNRSVTTERADADRGQLAKLVGAWRFEGSWSGEDGQKHSVQGRAAGVLVNNFFVLLDVQTTSGELAGQTSRQEGSLLFASEPGKGLTVTAWGDASPSITHLIGHSEEGGKVLTYLPASGPSNAVAVVVRFEGDNHFSTEISAGSGGKGVAEYTFTRATE